ncbi:hypothetical protein C0Q70_19966 [Pomacea canaliculata]|uniref:Ig-like domain-containing protein n=1 Tax=Pomacea canaliculata TaxID=400727 RepID=A0A2T7NE82_POMCA|nr:hypothetical protein C0Q70_19966 [Pomacea canaliculata]
MLSSARNASGTNLISGSKVRARSRRFAFSKDHHLPTLDLVTKCEICRDVMRIELKSVVTSTTIIPIDPVFLPTANNITVREGGKAELPCSVQYLSTKKVDN